MCAKEPNFIARQYAFTAFVRDPMNAPAPADVPRARLQVYRELFHKNIDNSLSACFPVLKAILGDEWDPLVQDFFARHRAHTPIYRKLPREFLAYLQQHHRRVYALIRKRFMPPEASLDGRAMIRTKLEPFQPRYEALRAQRRPAKPAR